MKPKEIIIKRMRTKLKKKQKSGMKLKRKSIWKKGEKQYKYQLKERGPNLT